MHFNTHRGLLTLGGRGAGRFGIFGAKIEKSFINNVRKEETNKSKNSTYNCQK